MPREVKILECDFEPPFNPLDLQNGESVTFIARRYRIGRCVREVRTGVEREKIEGKIMRIYVDLKTPVFGAPYVDVLAGRTIALLEALFREHGLPLKITLTASGKEPNKWYEVKWESPAGSETETSPPPV